MNQMDAEFNEVAAILSSVLLRKCVSFLDAIDETRHPFDTAHATMGANVFHTEHDAVTLDVDGAHQAVAPANIPAFPYIPGDKGAGVTHSRVP
jgi:hypothetical protein